MEIQQSVKMKLTFKNATIVLTILNIVTALYLLHGFLSSSHTNDRDSVELRNIRESEKIRLAMQPLELIKRVKEIQQEVYAEQVTVERNDTKQNAVAVDLSKRLKDFRALNDAASLKALEEWRKRKMERVRQRQLEKNGTATSQA
ncbi:hypothetical protein ACFE04_011679 [Oxalis oulophora]